MNEELKNKNQSRGNRLVSFICDSLTMIQSRGFTLIELLIVIAVIGILSSFMMMNYIGVRERARDGVRKSDLGQIQSALELYRADQGFYPSVLPACDAQLADGGVVYMKKMPCDPLDGTPDYVYTYTPSPPGCILGACTGYALVACIENANDSQAVADTANCPTAGYSFTIENP